MLDSGAGKRYWHDEHKVPYMIAGKTWVGYEDMESITIKVSLVRTMYMVYNKFVYLSKVCMICMIFFIVDDYVNMCNKVYSSSTLHGLLMVRDLSVYSRISCVLPCAIINIYNTGTQGSHCTVSRRVKYLCEEQLVTNITNYCIKPNPKQLF